MTLHIDGTSFPFTESAQARDTTHGTSTLGTLGASKKVQWDNVGFSWTDNQQVQVRLTYMRTHPPTVSLSASPNPVQEGSPVTVTATLSYPLTEDVSIPLNTAMVPFNLATVGAYDIAIPAGQTTGTHEFTAPQLEDGEMKQYQIAVDWWRMRKPRPLSSKGSQSHAGDPYLVNVQVLDENADPHQGVGVGRQGLGACSNNYGRLCFAFTLDRAGVARGSR